MQQLTPLSTQNRQKRAIREQTAAYIFDEVMEAWLNSCPVTPAVMCSSLKCGQQTTLSRTVADYTTALDWSCVWWLEQWFLENYKAETSEHFLTHSVLYFYHYKHSHSGVDWATAGCTTLTLSVVTGNSAVPVTQQSVLLSSEQCVSTPSLKATCILPAVTGHKQCNHTTNC